MIHPTGCHGTLQVVLGILQPPPKVSHLEKWIFWQSIPVLGSGEHLCDTTKSLTTVLAVIPGSLETSLTSFPSRVFEVFPFLPLPSLF